MPKYLRAQSDHLNLNLNCKAARRAGFTPTLIAVDLSKLIFKSENALYMLNSLRRLGGDTEGLVMEIMRSSAYADILRCELEHIGTQAYKFEYRGHESPVNSVECIFGICAQEDTGCSSL